MILKQNYITGERVTLLDLTPKEGYIVDSMGFTFIGDRMLYQYSTYLYDPEAKMGYEQTDHRNYAYFYDLTTGETEQLLDEPCQVVTYDARVSLLLSMCTENFLTIAKTEPFDKYPMPMEEYLELGHTEEEYIEHYEENLPKRNIYSVNRKTGEERFLYSSHEAKQNDSACFRNGGCSYVIDDTVYVYDSHTGEVRECFQQENIGWQGYLDGRIFCNYHDGDPYGHNYRYLWYDLTTGEIQAFNESQSGFVFGLDEETADYFYSKYGYNGKHYISKQDFYNENYDNAF